MSVLGEALKERLEPPEEPDVDQDEIDRLFEEKLERFEEAERERYN